MSTTLGPTTTVAARKVHTWEYLEKIGVPIAMFLGAYQAVIMRQWMSPDGVAYLDMGDRIWNEGWFAAANGYWSPLYPALLGGLLKLFHPSMYHEFAMVHVVNVGICALTVCAFQFFWKRTIATMLGPIPIAERENSRTSWAWLGSSVVVLEIEKHTKVCLSIYILRIQCEDRGIFVGGKLRFLLVYEVAGFLLMHLNLLRLRAPARLCVDGTSRSQPQQDDEKM